MNKRDENFESMKRILSDMDQKEANRNNIFAFTGCFMVLFWTISAIASATMVGLIIYILFQVALSF